MKSDCEKMYLISQQMFTEGKVKQSISILEKIIGNDPNYILAYCALGRAYVAKQDYQKAERVLLKAINLNAKWHLPHLYLGWTHERQNEIPQALAAYERAVKLKPDDFDSRAYLGYMYQRLDKQEAGVRELQVACQLNPHDITMIYNLANGLHKLDQSIEAIKLLNEALEILEAYELAHLYYLLASIYLDLRKLDEAYANIQKAIELNPDIATFHNKLGDIYYEKGEFEDAIRSFGQALDSDSEKSNALKGIGLSYLNLENWQAAVEAFKKAQELGETVFYGLGFAYFESGDDERGIENFRNEILNNGPEKIEASYYLGFAYAAIGDHRSSIEVFKQFLELSADKTNDPVWKEWRTEAKKQIEERSK